MKDLNLLEASEREIIKARRAYQKQWRAANQDKVKETQNRFWLKKAAEQQADAEKEQQNANQK